MQLVIVDTNVLVSGVAGNGTGTAPERIVDAWVLGRFKPCYCLRLLGEWQDVLSRPHLVKRHGLGASDLERLITRLLQLAVAIEAPHAGPRAPDPNDQVLWDMLAYEPRTVLVTGDKLLLASDDHAGRVIRPAEFAEGLPS